MWKSLNNSFRQSYRWCGGHYLRGWYASILLLVFVVAGASCLHTHCSESAHAAQANIVVERPENNGSVNILPCTIIFSDGQRCTLSGGDHVIVSIWSGASWAAASSPDPYRPDSADSMSWRSPRFNFHVAPSETLRLSVEPKWKGSTYIGGWTIERVANKTLGN
jgi:hypothetical protein